MKNNILAMILGLLIISFTVVAELPNKNEYLTSFLNWENTLTNQKISNDNIKTNSEIETLKSRITTLEDEKQKIKDEIRNQPFPLAGTDNGMPDTGIVVTENQTKPKINSINDPNQIPLQKIQNLGYEFYIGEIESSSNTTNINDDIKNQITKAAYTAHFPTSLLKNIPIIILNNLALTEKQYVIASNTKLQIPDLKPDFLSEGGIYTTYNNGSAIIFINKSTITQGQLTDVFTHELGHAVGSTLTDQDWVTFYKLRNIPIGTERRGSDWNTSPTEDFAEVYKNIFTNNDIRTYFGQLIPAGTGRVFYGDIETGKCSTVSKDALLKYDIKPVIAENDPDMLSKAFDYALNGGVASSTIRSKINTDETVQACRSDVMLNPPKYPSEWSYGEPYKSSVDKATKGFISSIMNNLNKK